MAFVQKLISEDIQSSVGFPIDDYLLYDFWSLGKPTLDYMYIQENYR